MRRRVNRSKKDLARDAGEVVSPPAPPAPDSPSRALPSPSREEGPSGDAGSSSSPKADPDLARMLGESVRPGPRTFRAARCFDELHRGWSGRRPLSVLEIAALAGTSDSYVRSLIRFFRVLGPDVKAAWEADRDGRFTFQVLFGLTRLHQKGDAEAIERILEQVREGGRLNGLSEAAIARPRLGMTKRQIAELEGRLAHERKTLAARAVRATDVHDLVRAFIGKEPRATASRIVNEMLTAPASTASDPGKRATRIAQISSVLRKLRRALEETLHVFGELDELTEALAPVRPPPPSDSTGKYSPELTAHALSLLAAGRSLDEVRALTGIPRTTLHDMKRRKQKAGAS